MKSYKFTINGTIYEVEVKEMEDNMATMEVNGTPYQIQIHKEVKQTKTPRLIRPVQSDDEKKPIQRTPGSTKYKITSPLPGEILQILVKVGDSVKKDQKLMIMESMKMENSVLSEKDGIIDNITVSVKDAVLQGDVLLEIV